MGYDDRFYYGKARVIVYCATGSNVSVTDGTSTWTGTSLDSKCEFMLPGTKRYSITVGNETKTVTASYGECCKVNF